MDDAARDTMVGTSLLLTRRELRARIPLYVYGMAVSGACTLAANWDSSWFRWVCVVQLVASGHFALRSWFLRVVVDQTGVRVLGLRRTARLPWSEVTVLAWNGTGRNAYLCACRPGHRRPKQLTAESPSHADDMPAVLARIGQAGWAVGQLDAPASDWWPVDPRSQAEPAPERATRT